MFSKIIGKKATTSSISLEEQKKELEVELKVLKAKEDKSRELAAQRSFYADTLSVLQDLNRNIDRGFRLQRRYMNKLDAKLACINNKLLVNVGAWNELSKPSKPPIVTNEEYERIIKEMNPEGN